MPPEFIEELATLQDNVPPLTEEQVVRVMEQELGVPWEDVFETIDPQPLAAGTIAQVHRATLADHTKAVVKVQRPDAKEQIEQDLALLEVFAEKVADRPGLRQVVDMQAVFEHLSESLHRELDFRREAENIDRMGSVIEDFTRLRVPVVHADYSTSRLLVMQDIGGGPAASAPEGPARREAARQLLESFYKQILVDGFFHADPHPGNLMWQPEEETLYFLDLGMIGEVGPDLREHMMLLLMAFWQQDVGFLTDVTLMLTGAINRTDLDVEAFQEELGALMARNRGVSLKEIQLGPVLQEMTEIALRHDVALPASLTLTAKALAQMQLAAATLDPDVDPFDVAGKFLMRNLVRGMGAKFDPKTLFYQAQRFKVRFEKVVEAIERLIGARPGQKLEVNFRAATLETTIRRAGRRLAISLTAGAAILASALTAVSSDRVAGLGAGGLRRDLRRSAPRAAGGPDPQTRLARVLEVDLSALGGEGGVQLLLALALGLRALLDAAHHHLLQHERDHRHHEADHPPLDPAPDALRPAPFEGHVETPRRSCPTARNTTPHTSASHAHTGSNAPT